MNTLYYGYSKKLTWGIVTGYFAIVATIAVLVS